MAANKPFWWLHLMRLYCLTKMSHSKIIQQPKISLKHCLTSQKILLKHQKISLKCCLPSSKILLTLRFLFNLIKKKITKVNDDQTINLIWVPFTPTPQIVTHSLNGTFLTFFDLDLSKNAVLVIQILFKLSKLGNSNIRTLRH